MGKFSITLLVKNVETDRTRSLFIVIAYSSVENAADVLTVLGTPKKLQLAM